MNRLAKLLPSLKRDQWLLFIAFLLWGFSTGVWFHLQPLYIEMLGANPQQMGAAIGISGIAAVFLYIPMGLLADRLRQRKQIIVASWVIGTVSTLVIAVAPSWQWAIPGLGLFTIANFANPIVAAYLADSERGGNVSRVFAITSAGWSIGRVAGPALGGWIAEGWGLRSVLVVATAINVLSTLATVLLREQPAGEVKAHASPWRLLADAALIRQMVVLMLIIFTFDLGTVLAPAYLRDVKGLNLQQIGQMGTAASIGSLVLMLVLGQLRPERRAAMLLTLLIVAVGLGLLWVAPGVAGAGLGALALLAVAYFFRGGTEAFWPVSRGRLAYWLHPSALNLGFSVMDTASQVARSVAPVAAGFLYAQSPDLPLKAGLAAVGVMLLLTLALPQHKPEAPVVSPEAGLPQSQIDAA